MANISFLYGTHLAIDVNNAPEDLAHEVVKGNWFANEIARRMPVRIVKEVKHQFEPPDKLGYTVCLLLDSSHVTVHCYAEARSISIDAYCCERSSSWTDAVEQFVNEQLPDADILSTVTPRYFGSDHKMLLPPVVDNATLERKVEAHASQVTIISPRLFNEFNQFSNIVTSNVYRGVRYTYTIPSDRIIDFDRFTLFLRAQLCNSHGLDEAAADEKIRKCVTTYVLDSEKMAIPWEMGIYDLQSDIGTPQQLGFIEHPNRPDHNLLISGSTLSSFQRMVEQTIQMSTLGALRIVSDLKIMFDNFYDSVMLLPKVIADSALGSSAQLVNDTIEIKKEGPLKSQLVNDTIEIKKEGPLKSVLHLLLRSRYESILREVQCPVTDPNTGTTTHHRIDFALSGLGVAIEVKHGRKSEIREIRRTILDYQEMMKTGTAYHTLVVFVYNPKPSNDKLRILESEFTRTDQSVGGKKIATYVFVRPE